MTKKTKDAQSLLKALNNASSVPRGDQPASPVVEVEAEKRTTVSVKVSHHKRLKILAAMKGQNLQEALDLLLEKHLPALPDID